MRSDTRLCPPFTPREESSPYGLGSDWDLPEARWGSRAKRPRPSDPAPVAVKNPGPTTW